MYIHIFVYIYMYVYIYIHIHLYTYKYMYIHIKGIQYAEAEGGRLRDVDEYEGRSRIEIDALHRSLYVWGFNISQRN
jgi:hypothetical protein